jgi:hypothetical protein
MGIGAVSHAFCRVCGTEHRESGTCPGALAATGAERPGWRVEVQTPFGNEAIGVLLAPVHDQWRARIVTYPNVLWSAPGGRGTLKFVGDTAEEAEAQAVRFVEEHVRRKRYARSDGMATVGAAATGRAVAPRPRPHFSAADARKRYILPVRFGAQRATTRGTTVNLSHDGMFVGAPAPEDDGQSLLIHVYLEGHMVPMRGLVMWNRFEAEPDRPVGMGIRLSNPPALYKTFVASLV